MTPGLNKHSTAPNYWVLLSAALVFSLGLLVAIMVVVPSIATSKSSVNLLEEINLSVAQFQTRLTKLEGDLFEIEQRQNEQRALSLSADPLSQRLSSLSQNQREQQRLDLIQEGINVDPLTSFYDPPTQPPEQIKHEPESAESYNSRILAMISEETPAPEMAQSLMDGIQTPELHNLTSNIEYSGTTCSINRCSVMADISATEFSSINMSESSNSEDYSAVDNYRKFVVELNKSVNNSMGRDVQVASYRQGDKISFLVIPSPAKTNDG